jgi:tetratricopeptide (TPR) repeat protein
MVPVAIASSGDSHHTWDWKLRSQSEVRISLSFLKREKTPTYQTHVYFIATALMVLALSLPSPCVHAFGEFHSGTKAARAGDLQKAIRLWSKVIRKHPKSYAAHVNRGTAYLMTGHVIKGIRDWHKAKEYGPIFAYGVYGADFIDQAPGNKKILNFAKPLELDPDYVAVVAMTGITCLDLGRTEEALKLYRRSMELTRNPLLKNHFDHWIKSIEKDEEE